MKPGQGSLPAWDISSLTQHSCVHCSQCDWQQGIGPRTLVSCSCCEANYIHVSCFESKTGQAGSTVLAPEFRWLCSEACSEVEAHLESLVGKRLALAGEGGYTVEVIRYNEVDRASVTSVGQAEAILKSAFTLDPLDDGRDLLELVCKGYATPADKSAKDPSVCTADDNEDEDEELDYSNFRVVALRKHGNMVSTATLRVFGDKFAELPFVATKDGHRRQGHCRRLMQAVENLLNQIGVCYLVLPSVKKVQSMWRMKFGFKELTSQEHNAIDGFVVSVDLSTSVLMKKVLGVQSVLGKRNSMDTRVCKRPTRNNAHPKKPRKEEKKVLSGSGDESRGDAEDSNTSTWHSDSTSSDTSSENVASPVQKEAGKGEPGGRRKAENSEVRGLHEVNKVSSEIKAEQSTAKQVVSNSNCLHEPGSGKKQQVSRPSVARNRRNQVPGGRMGIVEDQNQMNSLIPVPTGLAEPAAMNIGKPPVPTVQPVRKRRSAPQAGPTRRGTSVRRQTSPVVRSSEASRKTESGYRESERKLRFKRALQSYREYRRDYMIGAVVAEAVRLSMEHSSELQEENRILSEQVVRLSQELRLVKKREQQVMGSGPEAGTHVPAFPISTASFLRHVSLKETERANWMLDESSAEGLPDKASKKADVGNLQVEADGTNSPPLRTGDTACCIQPPAPSQPSASSSSESSAGQLVDLGGNCMAGVQRALQIPMEAPSSSRKCEPSPWPVGTHPACQHPEDRFVCTVNSSTSEEIQDSAIQTQAEKYLLDRLLPCVVGRALFDGCKGTAWASVDRAGPPFRTSCHSGPQTSSSERPPRHTLTVLPALQSLDMDRGREQVCLAEDLQIQDGEPKKHVGSAAVMRVKGRCSGGASELLKTENVSSGREPSTPSLDACISSALGVSKKFYV